MVHKHPSVNETQETTTDFKWSAKATVGYERSLRFVY